MNSDYDDVFNLEGPLARALPGYAYRPEQAAMAKAVGAALARLEPLIVEAARARARPSLTWFRRCCRGAA